YVASHGLLHERRLFVEARGQEGRGEDILTVPDARARGQFDRAATSGRLGFALRLHIHPAIGVDFDAARGFVILTLPSEEAWLFRASGGEVSVEESVFFEPDAARPEPTQQVVVRAEVTGYLGQVTWSFARIAEAP